MQYANMTIGKGVGQRMETAQLASKNRKWTQTYNSLAKKG